MDSPDPSGLPRGDRGIAPRRPEASYPRALRVGLAISAVLHLWVLAVYPSLVRLEPGAPVPLPPGPAVPPSGGIQVIGIVAVDGVGALAEPEDPVEVRPVEGPSVRPGAPRLGDPPGTGLVAPGPSAAERLRPRLNEERLWAPLDRALNDLTPEQRIELELQGRIAEWQDSAAEAAAAERALTDWTRTDAQGRRWGVSEGQLHLGDVTLPLPFAFGTPVGRRDEIRARAWEWEEITRGAASGEIRDSWKDRAQAIRERRDRERAAAKPDTTRIRR